MKLFILLMVSMFVYGKEPGFVFSALIENQWIIVVYEDGQFKEFKTELEPRTFDYDFVNKRISYIASDKTLRLKSEIEKKEKILLVSKLHAYTQPMFTPSGKDIVLIKLIEGNSVNTDIISINVKTKKTKKIVSQRSTQLEPYILNDTNLYYSSVSCVEGCGQIIQELWYKHILSGEAYQLTLTNTISHQPSVDYNQKNIYFSSDKKGHYHIWKMSLTGHEYTQLTKGEVTDSYPMPTRNNEVLFIRKIGIKSSLMKITIMGDIKEIVLPKRYEKIRNLKAER